LKIAILSGGNITSKEWLYKMLKGTHRIICVDGGSRYASLLGIVPYMIVGDLDSIDPNDLDYFSRQGVIIKKYAPEKDNTDTALALNEALAQKPSEIIVLGASGSRLDHTLANIHLLRNAAESGVPVSLVDEFNEISIVMPGESRFIDGNPGDLFSLLPLTTEVRGVNVRGARWPLEDAIFTVGNPYGISNRLAGTRASVSIKSGILMLIRTHEHMR